MIYQFMINVCVIRVNHIYHNKYDLKKLKFEIIEWFIYFNDVFRTMTVFFQEIMTTAHLLIVGLIFIVMIYIISRFNVNNNKFANNGYCVVELPSRVKRAFRELAHTVRRSVRYDKELTSKFLFSN